jgi:hypothetical protein
MDGLTEGRMIHYVLPEDELCRSAGEHRPAIVVKVWNKESGVINIQVFTDASNDYHEGHAGFHGLFWATSVQYDESGASGTWHFIERA